MVRKKIDNRLRILIENAIIQNYRSMFVVVGEKARDQVVILHQMLSKSQVKTRPSVLWCYKKDLGFTTHRKKRMRLLQKKIKSGIDPNEDDPLELFIAQTNIRYCYYHETHRILGNTYGMLILQDFEAITPNLLARTVETVEGGGMIVILLNTLTSLKQLYTMAMDVHARYRTEAHQDVVARFNERFILSLVSCKNCVVIDDKLNVLPISSHIADIAPVPKPDSTTPLSPEEIQLNELKESLTDTQPVGSLINCCKTLDQANAVLKFIDVIAEKTLSSTVSLTAARGRGKSAAMGLAIAGAIAFNYSNIYVTSPSPENLKTLFDFVLKGFDAIHLKEHLDYDIIQSTNVEFNKAIVRINIFREHRQTIQYIHPTDAQKNKLLGQSAELVVIDEAAAIPLPIVKSLLGPYLVFMASTINGYEGTGRSLSLKLLQQLRQQSASYGNQAGSAVVGRALHELNLNESIRYNNGDSVEAWLNKLLCLDASIVESVPIGCPVPTDCQLYYINRDTLFSYHKSSEAFLQKIMALYVSSHYKNSPNDLQMMSDAPAHHLFCLLPPITAKQKSKGKIPDILCFIQVCLEGEISQDSIINSLSRGKRASGDLIPWTISQQYQDNQFGSLSGVRVVRIATNPNYQGMGYGTRALQLLEDYYKGEFNIDLNEQDGNEQKEMNNDKVDGNVNDDNDLIPRKSLLPLLFALKERKAEYLDYVGVSFGLTSDLLRFWKKSGFVPVYIRQTPNDLTGEHSCIMLKLLMSDEDDHEEGNLKITRSNYWLGDFWLDFRRRFISLLSYQFKTFSAAFALNILHNTKVKVEKNKYKKMTKDELENFLTLYDLKRLELYSQNLVDYHLIVDLLPSLARLYFTDRFGPECHLSHVQNAILLSIGLQHKTIDEICAELEMPSSQILGLFNRIIRKLTTYLQNIEEEEIANQLGELKQTDENLMKPVRQSLNAELEEAAREVKKAEKKEFKHLSAELAQYAIKGSEDDWDNALKGGKKSIISIKSLAKRSIEEEKSAKNDNKSEFKQNKSGKKKKFKKFKK